MEYEFVLSPQYQWSKCGKCFNIKTGREISQCYKSGCIGYYFNCRFYSLTFLRKNIQKIKPKYCPF